MAFNHLPAGAHDAFGPLSRTPVTHSVPMANTHGPGRPKPPVDPRPTPGTVLDRLSRGPSRAARITHTEHLPPRAGRHAVWPDRIRTDVVAAIQAMRHRPSVGTPGRGGRARPGRRVRGRRHRHRLGQVPGLPRARALRPGRRRRGPERQGRHGPVPGPHQGPGGRSAARRTGTGRPAGQRRPPRRLRRGHARRGTRVGAPVRELRPDQPRHAAPRDPPGPPALVLLPAGPALRRDRRVPHLPRSVRLPRGAGPAPAYGGCAPATAPNRSSCWPPPRPAIPRPPRPG